MRRHGWQLPLHSLQIVGTLVFTFLVASFFVFLGPYLGNRIVENAILSLFSFTAFSVAFLYIRCTWIDPTDRTNAKKMRGLKTKGLAKFNYRFIIQQVIVRFFSKIESKIMNCCIRRKYLDPWNSNVQIQPLLPFPFVVMDDAVAPNLKDDDTTFCSLCDFEVRLHSKHCRSCNRCVDGFDHHCRWLNNCIGRRNYTTFILLMVFTLLMLIIEGGVALAIFIRSFADREGISLELKRKLHVVFPKGLLPAICVFLVLLTAYGTAALSQLFLFHVVLIRKGMRTYDYILAMREEGQSIEDPFVDSDSSSDESFDFESPEKPNFVSRLFCNGHKASESTRRLSITIVEESTNEKKHEIRIDPWKLIKMSKEKALLAAERAREKIMRNKSSQQAETPLKPLPSEAKKGLSMSKSIEITPMTNTTSWLSSPRRRFSNSSSPRPQRYRTNFDLKLTEVSRDLETYITRQAVCSVLKKNEDES